MSFIARWCFRHRFAVMAAWVLALIALTALAQTVKAEYSISFSLPGTGSTTAQQLLASTVPAQSGDSDTIVWQAGTGTVRDAAVMTRMSAAMTGARGKMLMLCVSGAITISPPATPASAVMSGSSVATSEPNAMNSTIAAASTPTTVPRDSGGCLAWPMAGPPSWTSSPGARAACAASITRTTSAGARRKDCLVKLTTA